MKRYAFLVFILVSACASLSYKPPVERNILKSATVEGTYDVVWRKAIAWFAQNNVGPIALVWGEAGDRRSDGFGLAKILAFHPEVLDDLQGRIERMRVTSRTANRIQLRGETDQAGVRLDWDGQEKSWLISAFDSGVPRRSEKYTGSLQDLWGKLAQTPRRDIGNVGEGSDVSKPTSAL